MATLKCFFLATCKYLATQYKSLRKFNLWLFVRPFGQGFTLYVNCIHAPCLLCVHYVSIYMKPVIKWISKMAFLKVK